jgi:hypothetical protein
MTDFGQVGASGWAVAIQENGRIVVAGETSVYDSKFAIARYRSS